MSEGPIAVISLASAPDAGAWITDIVAGAELVPVSVDERRLEAQLEAAFARGPKRAWIAFDHVLMGYLCRRVAEALAPHGVGVASLVHPSAVVSPQATLGEGVLVAAGAVVAAGATIGAHARVHERSVVSRGASIAAYSTIDPGCVIGEHASIGAHGWIRRGVIIEARTQIGDHCEFHVPGVFGGAYPEGHVHFAGVDGPVRIHRFG